MQHTRNFLFFLAILKKKKRLYDSGPSLCIFLGMRIAGWRYCYELMATKHHTVKGQRQFEIATLVLHIFFVIYYD